MNGGNMSIDPLCFVLMPFGRKKDPSGGPDIDFDKIYSDAIEPGIRAAGMEPIRADEERTGGIIHKAMFERLLLCDFAVADLTTANANVFYELGVRHATRPKTTLPIFAVRQNIPFDVNYLRSLPYELGEDNRFEEIEAARLRDSLTKRLKELRELAREETPTDSPIFQLLEGYSAPDIARLKTDTFRDQVRYSEQIKQALSDARNQKNLRKFKDIETELGSIDQVEAGVAVDLFLSYRALEAWDEMISLYERLPETLRRAVLIREQLAFACNRLGNRNRAIEILEAVVDEHGASSETCGLMGRVYKDLWADAKQANQVALAIGYLDKAIAVYTRGFEADWRDAYPGINAVTLLDIKGDEASLSQKEQLLPVVRFAVTQRLKHAKPDYWDHATLLELAVLDHDQEESQKHLAAAMASIREIWEPKTTANNLRLIHEERVKRSQDEIWLNEIITTLEQYNK